MAVVIETTLGDITVDLFVKQRPTTCLNFLKLCKIKYYNYNLFHSIRSGFIAQTGDPTGEGSGGVSIWGVLEGPEKRFFTGERMPKIRHTNAGLLSMVSTEDSLVGSQFFFTLAPDLDSLDGMHCVIGEVTEGHDVLRKLNEVICDESHRPYQDVRITHTVILEDPFNDPPSLKVPSRSPSPSAERLRGGRIAPDEEIDETMGKSAAEIQELIEEKEAKARATILEIVGDLPDADIAPPENVLFVCKLNPVTTDEDLEIIFSRFGKIVSCEVIRDKKTGDSLQYAFIEFSDKKSCENAYFKMDNVLIDDRRIHVDFSQSVSKIKWLGKGRGVKHMDDDMDRDKNQNKRSRRSQSRDKETLKQNSKRREIHEKGGHKNRDNSRNDIDRRDRHRNDRESRRKERRRSRSHERNYAVNNRSTKHEVDKSASIHSEKSKDYNRKRNDEKYIVDKTSQDFREKSKTYDRKKNYSDEKNNIDKNNTHPQSEKSKTYYRSREDNNVNDKEKLREVKKDKKDKETHESSSKNNTDDKKYNIKEKDSSNTNGYSENSKRIPKSEQKSKDIKEEQRQSTSKKQVVRTPSPAQIKREREKTKSKQSISKQKTKKAKRKYSTSSSSESSSSSSDSDSSSSSDSDEKRKTRRRKKRKHSTSESSSSETSSSSSSSSESSSDSSSSSSDSEPRKRKSKKPAPKKNAKKPRKK